MTSSAAATGGLLAANNLSDLANKQTALNNLTQDAAVTGMALTSTATNGFQIYNTVDQTTNYERLAIRWVANVATIGTANGGTGTQRALAINASNFDLSGSAITLSGNSIISANSAGTLTLRTLGTTSPSSVIITPTNAITNTSGSSSMLQITPSYNQASGTAANTDLLINRTQTAVGSGAQLLIDCQVGGTSLWALGNTGRQTRYSGVNLAGWGSPAIYASGRSTAQTAAVASVTTYTVGAADGSFEVLANVLVTTATTHNFTVTCAYTDEGNTARTLTLNFSVVAGTIGTTIVNTGGAVPYEGVPLRIRAKAATAITIATVGTFTSVTYNVEASILQIA